MKLINIDLDEFQIVDSFFWSLSDDLEGLKIIIEVTIEKNNNRVTNYLMIHFHDHIIYLKKPEIYQSREKLGQNSVRNSKILYQVEQGNNFSEYINDESDGYFRDDYNIDKLKHYFIITNDDIIEIFAFDSPNINLLRDDTDIGL